MNMKFCAKSYSKNLTPIKKNAILLREQYTDCRAQYSCEIPSYTAKRCVKLITLDSEIFLTNQIANKWLTGKE